jgi:UDP-N-acetylglucosamine--N-acetylmuramyl-(pentapeptide) pyrophosphoryl-undecaprenol N-acetylglucosamine transferase
VSAFVRAFVIVVRFRPDVIGSAGGYTSVPVVMAGSVLGVPSWVHQMDARPILTTRLIAPFASRITVSFQQTLKSFPLVKTRVVGNPVRASLYEGSRNHAIELFGLNPKLRTVLVVGGGTGAKWLNEAILSQVKKICARANVIHLTGRGKSMAVAPIVNYHQIEFLDSDMKHALACADVVVSRAGMGSITELCALSKPSILVPLPKSAQQQNARALGSAVEVIEQEQGPVVLRKKILELLDDPERRVELSQQIVRALRTDCAQELVFMLEEIAK